jgi:hypothetical protein
MSRVESPFTYAITDNEVTLQISVSREFIEQVKTLDNDPSALLDSILRDGYRGLIEKIIASTEDTLINFDKYFEKPISDEEMLKKLGIDLNKD